jgi:hypothetical protein
LQKVKTSRTIRAQVIRLIRVYIAQCIILDGIAGLMIVLSYLRRDELFRDVGNIIEIKFYFFPSWYRKSSLPRAAQYIFSEHHFGSKK